MATFRAMSELVIRNQFPAGETVELVAADGQTKKAKVKDDGSVTFKDLTPGPYRANFEGRSILVHSKEPGENAPIGSVPTEPVAPTEVRRGLETGSRADTTLPEGDEPVEETQTVTPVDEPAPAGAVTP